MIQQVEAADARHDASEPSPQSLRLSATSPLPSREGPGITAMEDPGAVLRALNRGSSMTIPDDPPTPQRTTAMEDVQQPAAVLRSGIPSRPALEVDARLSTSSTAGCCLSVAWWLAASNVGIEIAF